MTALDATRSQQIMGFFIEEAFDHLNTLEQGLLNLQATLADSEQANEMFRAAHSVKGGAAILGLTGIQAIAHRMEDCFRLLVDYPIQVDQNVESMFLQGFDALQLMLNELQGSGSLTDSTSERIVREVEPTINQLQNYLKALANGESPSAPPSIPRNIAAEVTEILKDMLEPFKQPASDRSRDMLFACCDRLKSIEPEVESWQGMLRTARTSIANPSTPYRTLAPVLIKELKQAGELLQAGRGAEIAPSNAFRQLANPAPAITAEPATTGQISIPMEPRAAARILIQSFQRQQLKELTQLLIQEFKGR
jgi:chemotaxis protein histidine kinase CheA